MSVENSPGDETFSATGTNVWPFAGVVTLVDHQGGPLGESFAALVAGIFSLAGVGDVMSPQQRLAGETLAAHLAGVRFFAGVRSVVDLQTFCRLQLFAAERAEVSTPLVIRHVAVSFHFVLLQHRLVLVNLPANVAFMLGVLRLVFIQLLLDQGCWVVVVQPVVLLQAGIIRKIRF